MAENLTSLEILDIYIKSGLHPKDGDWVVWPKETIVVCEIDLSNNTKDIVIKHNILHGDHAEKILMEYINSDLDITTIKNITIYTNYSPCIECSVKLQKLKENVPNLQIKFSSLYDIKRPSCAESTCNCHENLMKKYLAIMERHEALMKHSERFRRLMELDAWPFQEEDWHAFTKLLKEKDEQKGNDTSVLDGLRYGKKYGVWRNGEDTKMMADYKELSKKMSQSTPNKNTSSTDEPSRSSEGSQATVSTGDRKSRRKLDYSSLKE